MWRWLIPLAVTVVVAVGLVTTGQRTVHVPTPKRGTGPTTPAPFTDQPCDRGVPAPKTYQHVIWIWMGDRGSHEVIGKHTPAYYTNTTLIDNCGLAARYYAVTSPAVPNLVAALSGKTAGLSNNGVAHVRGPSLFSQIPTWRVYMGGMGTACQLTDSSDTSLGGYLVRDNPGVLFDTRQCAARDRPLTEFDASLTAGKLGQFTVIVPPECSSMSFVHECGLRKAQLFVTAGDTWLAGIMGRIFKSTLYQSRSTVVFVAWTEGAPRPAPKAECVRLQSSACHVAMIAIAPWVKNVTFTTPLTHYSLLGVTEALLGVKLLGHAQPSPAMRAAFGL
jgi:phosphatidylinositol-3-phosphatase